MRCVVPSLYVKAFQIRDPCFGQLFVPRHSGPFAHPPPPPNHAPTPIPGWKGVWGLVLQRSHEWLR